MPLKLASLNNNHKNISDLKIKTEPLITLSLPKALLVYRSSESVHVV